MRRPNASRRVASRVASRMRVDGADDRARTPARGALSTSAVARFDELDEDDVGDVDFQHDDDEDARGDGARDDDGARDGVVGRYRKMRARFDSFSGALSDARGAFDAFAFTGWSEEQKKIVVKLAFLATFAVMFYATMAVIFAHVWIGMAKAIGVRVLWGVCLLYTSPSPRARG